MKAWSELTRVGFLGTGRETVPNISLDPALDSILEQTAAFSPEARLLSMAATIDFYERVGQKPPLTMPTTRWETMPDDRPQINPAATQHLVTMLNGRHQDLFPEFLTILNETNQRLPEILLPNMLQRAAQRAPLRPYLLPVLGHTGRWLAAQNPAWAYAAPAADTWAGARQIWQSDPTNMRLAFLSQLRHFHPERGRQLVESTWKSDAPGFRTTAMKTMKTGLSLADEPFLEMALDDRHAMIRRQAAELLASLAASRLCQRMIANTTGLLRWAPAEKHQIVVTFPPSISVQLARDGVIRNDGKNLSRLRSRQLVQMISAIPLSHWPEIWQASPEAIIPAIAASRWPRTLQQAFNLAALRQHSQAWAMALLTTGEISPATARLVQVLSPATCADLVRQTHARLGDLPPLAKQSPLLQIFKNWPHSWDREMGRFWIDRLALHLEPLDLENLPIPHHLRAVMSRLARICPPDLFDYATARFEQISQTSTAWDIAIRGLLATWQFRHRFYADLAE